MPEYSNYIEGLGVADPLDGSELFGVSQGGVAKSVTAQSIVDLSFGGLHTFASSGNNFPTSDIAGKFYIVADDHGNPGDPDYVSSNSWMISKIAGANEFSEYYIKS